MKQKNRQEVERRMKDRIELDNVNVNEQSNEEDEDKIVNMLLNVIDASIYAKNEGNEKSN